MSAHETEDIVDIMSGVESEDPPPPQSPRHGSTSTKDELLVSCLTDIRKGMQLTHELLAQMLAQSNASSS